MASEIKKGEAAKLTQVTPELMELVQQLISAGRQGDGERSESSVSLFTDVRDPKEIMTVPVYRFDGKFVVGFKDLNSDPYRKTPKYSENKLDIHRKLPNEPFVTLLLSTDGVTIDEKEVPLIDYMNNRMKIEIQKPDFEIKEQEIIKDHGLLARPSTSLATDFTDGDRPVITARIKNQTKETQRTFVIKLPGFEKPVTYIEAFLA